MDGNFIENRASDFSEVERSILIAMFYTSSYYSSSVVLGCSQVRVRFVFSKCLSLLRDLKMWDIYEMFVIIRDNLNMVRRFYKGVGMIR